MRGALGSFLQLFVTIGLLYSYSIGPYVSYLVFCVLCAIVPVVFVGCFIMMPESPYQLLKIGKKQEALESLARLRSKTIASVQKEADEMQVRIYIYIYDRENNNTIENISTCSILFPHDPPLFPCIFEVKIISVQTC